MWSTKRSSKVQKEDTSHSAYFADHRPADPQATDFCIPLCCCLLTGLGFSLCVKTYPEPDLLTWAPLRQAGREERLKLWSHMVKLGSHPGYSPFEAKRPWASHCCPLSCSWTSLIAQLVKNLEESLGQPVSSLESDLEPSGGERVDKGTRGLSFFHAREE